MKPWFPFASCFAYRDGARLYIRTHEAEFECSDDRGVLEAILRLSDGSLSADDVVRRCMNKAHPSVIRRWMKRLLQMHAITHASRRYEAFHGVTNNPQVATPEIPSSDVPAYSALQSRKHLYGSMRQVAFEESSFTKLLTDRRSSRQFTNDSLSPQILGRLLWCCHGETKRNLQIDGVRARTIPSGGGLFPLHVFVWTHRVRGMPCGVFAWDPSGRLYSRGRTPVSRMKRCLVAQEYADAAGAIVLVTADLARSARKYGDRGYRYANMEAGHAVQNLILSATESGIGSLVLGGFVEESASKVFMLPVDYIPLSLVVLGSVSVKP